MLLTNSLFYYISIDRNIQDFFKFLYVLLKQKIFLLINYKRAFNVNALLLGNYYCLVFCILEDRRTHKTTYFLKSIKIKGFAMCLKFK